MDDQKQGLGNPTIILMIMVAIFFDVLQWLLAFVFMDWLVGFYAFLTFYVWFKIKGMSFMKPKRFATMGGTFLVEVIPWLASLPAWTGAITFLAIDSKIKKVLPPIAQKVVSSTPGLKKAA